MTHRWRNCSLALILLATGLTSTPAQIQERIPTDIELHAAACIPMMQWGVRTSREALTEIEQGIATIRARPPEQQFALEIAEGQRRDAAKALETTDSALKRLQAYLLPRLMTLDAFSVMAANNRGEADVQELERNVDACNACSQAAIHRNPTKPDFAACAANECNLKPVNDRLAACRNPSWLPF